MVMTETMRRPIATLSGYDLWASTYDATDNPIVAVDGHVLPPMMDALGSWAGLCVLDAGCGTGRHTAWLAQRAERVLAMDFSEGMLAQARQRLAGASNVEFHQQDLSAPPFSGLADGCVDRALCALVGEHIPDLAGLFAELRRLLRPGGWLVFSVYHPFLALMGKEANFTSPDGTIQYRLGAELHLVSDYVNALRRAGLSLHALREVVATPALCEQLPALQKLRGQPVLLVLSGQHDGLREPLPGGGQK
jgi:malonyl-CoA O-methyltransferase